MANQKVQVRERAGLEESRLNEELVDFLRSKTFTYVCVALAVAVLGYSAFRKYKEFENKQVATAFAEFEQATSIPDPSPDTLERIAEAYSDVGAIGSRARLAAADAHLRVVRGGVKPGAVTDANGIISKDDVLSTEERTQHLERAGALYQQVLTKSQGVAGRVIPTIEAIYGLAAVAESKRDFEGAKKFYEQIVTMTEKGTFAVQAAVARNRIEALATMGDPKLISLEQVPWLIPKAPTVVNPNATPEQTANPAAPTLPPGIAAPQGPAPETAPNDGKPAEAKPADAKPSEAKPGETPPANPAPGGEKPAEPKPADPKPVEPKPADPKPAEPSAPPTNPK